MNLDDLVGKRVGFCGVDNLTFCVVTPEGERVAFEAVEDPDDGYRSMLEEVKSVPLDGLIFFATPVAELTVMQHPDTNRFRDGGYQLVDDTNHVWLDIGTDDAGDYYPCFRFAYSPPKVFVGCQQHDDCRGDAEMSRLCLVAPPPAPPPPEDPKKHHCVVGAPEWRSVKESGGT